MENISKIKTDLVVRKIHMQSKTRKKEQGNALRRMKTLIKKSHELGKVPGFDVAIIIRRNGRYTIYKSKEHKCFPPSMAELVSPQNYTCPSFIKMN